MPNEFLARFTTDTARRLTELRVALSADDLDAAASIAHSLIGSAAIVGAKQMASAAEIVQAAADAGDVAAARTGYEAVLAEFNRVSMLLDTDDYEPSGRMRPTSISQV